MAKKKSDESAELTMDNFVERIRQEIDKNYGKGSCVSGQDIVDRKYQIIPWSPSLDMLTGGGIRESTWISVSGPPKMTKTNSILKLAANAQKLNKMIYYLNIEGRIKDKDLSNTKGLDVSEKKFMVVNSTQEQIKSSQDFLKIAESILRSDPNCFLIFDSISALADERELDGGPGTQLRGANYIPIGQFINNMGQYVSATKAIVVGIVHKIANTSGKGAPTSERVCNRWKFQADYQLEAKYMEKWKSGEEIIGQMTHWHCRSTALGRPYLDCTTYLRYGIGIDDVFELIQYACACGLIAKTGAWYQLSFLEHHPELNIDFTKKYQGGEEVWKVISENEALAECLKKEVFALSGSLVTCGED